MPDCIIKSYLHFRIDCLAAIIFKTHIGVFGVEVVTTLTKDQIPTLDEYVILWREKGWDKGIKSFHTIKIL